MTAAGETAQLELENSHPGRHNEFYVQRREHGSRMLHREESHTNKDETALYKKQNNKVATGNSLEAKDNSTLWWYYGATDDMAIALGYGATVMGIVGGHQADGFR
ncbi:predicted protein [Histoplasma capsulatum G186AR]|uniref:Uncharacterized protein n=1 Tax=Ajellomyces capsulatus (strain G186AR / H82 / ATCC MYA-2454 / RMSCC 2432) TaxID=447093 RepID=C0NNN0_AJECG|nr:uncharacterized protein HCBG_04760 [Histoplasma capsulatum G186AR]EEH06540.1 predicted protein [Histoplasma capsulatum G186AR]